MTDKEYTQLEKRIANGKAWIEKIKQDGTYGNKDTTPYIKLWCHLVDLLLIERQSGQKEESKDHTGLVWFEHKWHSPAWVLMRKQEMEQDDKRAKARTRRAQLKEQKRSGLSTSEKRT